VSNATEIAIGSNPLNANTDGDEFPDGEEVQHGYDPVRIGEARLSDREDRTDTLAFLAWAGEHAKKTPDPLTDTQTLEAFLRATFNPPKLPVVDTNSVQQVTRSDLETVTAYLYTVSTIEYPRDIAQYAAIAEAIQRTGITEPLSPILETITEVERAYHMMPVPSSALAIHREYLLLFAQVRSLFQDLSRAREDPVRIAKNIVVGNLLVQKAATLEDAKTALGKAAREGNL
ncbi:MAG: hypothetical protein HY460_01995, partial [Parcubacteria group bacterium]|nr:hypothetical protein [Parcubacteria group bacterium]